MKAVTVKKLKELMDQNRLKFSDTDKGISVEFDLEDEELREIVEIEYGQTSQDVVQLFQCVVKKLIQNALGKDE
jgi:hypothetical protein